MITSACREVFQLKIDKSGILHQKKLRNSFMQVKVSAVCKVKKKCMQHRKFGFFRFSIVSKGFMQRLRSWQKNNKCSTTLRSHLKGYKFVGRGLQFESKNESFIKMQNVTEKWTRNAATARKFSALQFFQNCVFRKNCPFIWVLYNWLFFPNVKKFRNFSKYP